MNIKQALESTLIGVGDNYLVIENIDTFIDVVFTVHGVSDEQFEFTYRANAGEAAINLREITRLVYDNVEHYQDPFTYDDDVLYTETDGYHFIKLDIDITDASAENLQVHDIKVINAALDVGECLILTSLQDEVLNEQAGKTPSNFLEFNYDLALTLH